MKKDFVGSLVRVVWSKKGSRRDRFVNRWGMNTSKNRNKIGRQDRKRSS